MVMKKYYCVTTTFDDCGRVTAALTDIIQADVKPKNGYRCTLYKDIYTDWFDSLNAAKQHIADAQRA